MDGIVDIKGLDKAEVLKALWDGSHTQGYSGLFGPQELSLDDARKMIEKCNDDLYFDYVYGRVIKCNLSGDSFKSYLYNRDCGTGAAERIIDALRK